MLIAIAIAVLMILVMQGVITVPNRSLLKPVGDVHTNGGIAKEAFAVAGIPVRVAATGTSGPKIAVIERCNGANKNRGFCGINLAGPIDLGAVLDEEAVAVCDNFIMDGYAGVSPGLPIWIDPGAVPAPLSTFSFLTHTDPADGTLPIAMGWTATKIKFFPAFFAPVATPP